MTGCEDDISEHHCVVIIAGAVVGLEVAVELADCGADALLFFNSIQIAPVALTAAEVAERHLRPLCCHACHNVMCLVLRAVAPVADAVIEGDNADAIGHVKLLDESLERSNYVGVVGLDLDELDDVIIAKSFEVLAQGGDMIRFGVIVENGVLAALGGTVGVVGVQNGVRGFLGGSIGHVVRHGLQLCDGQILNVGDVGAVEQALCIVIMKDEQHAVAARSERMVFSTYSLGRPRWPVMNTWRIRVVTSLKEQIASETAL